MYRAERITIGAVLLLICGSTLYGLIGGYPRQAILFPVITSVCVVFFSVMRFIETARASRSLAENDIAAAEGEAAALSVRDAVVPFLWVFAALIFLWLLGYVVGLTVYVLVFLLAHGIGAAKSVLIALGTSVFIYVIFHTVLKVLLPAGVLGTLLGF